MSTIKITALRDAYMGAVKDTVLDLDDTAENRELLTLVTEEGRAVWARGLKAVALNCEARVPLAETEGERERWLRLASRCWDVC